MSLSYLSAFPECLKRFFQNDILDGVVNCYNFPLSIRPVEIRGGSSSGTHLVAHQGTRS